MSEKFPGHKCQLNNLRPETNLPRILPTASWVEKILRYMHESIMVSRKNPITSRNFLSQAAIARENRRLTQLPYYVIHPCSCFLTIWPVIVLFTYTIYLPVIPYLVVFYHRSVDSTDYIAPVIQMVTSIVLYLEIVINMHQAYYDHKNELFVLQMSEIRKRYLTTTLIPDIISSFPLLIIMRFYTHSNAVHHKLLSIFFVCFIFNFVNIPKILRFYRIISVYYDLSSRTNIMIKLIIGSLYLLHIVAILSIIISEFIVTHIDSEKESIYFMNHENQQSPELKYARAFLFTLEGFIGCGIVDLNNESIYQKYMNIIILFGGWICRALIAILLMKAFISHDRSAAMYVEFVQEVNDYCKKFKLPDSLTANIYMYIEHKFRSNYFNEHHIYQTLSSRLKTEITMDECKQLLEQVDIFKNLPQSVTKQIMGCLKLEIYLPGEIIAPADTVGDQMFFLSSGSAMVVSRSGKQIYMFEDGSYFGEISLLNENQKRITSIIAVELCETYILSKADFVKVIEPNSFLLKQMQNNVLKRKIYNDNILYSDSHLNL